MRSSHAAPSDLLFILLSAAVLGGACSPSADGAGVQPSDSVAEVMPGAAQTPAPSSARSGASSSSPASTASGSAGMPARAGSRNVTAAAGNGSAQAMADAPTAGDGSAQAAAGAPTAGAARGQAGAGNSSAGTAGPGQAGAGAADSGQAGAGDTAAGAGGARAGAGGLTVGAAGAAGEAGASGASTRPSMWRIAMLGDSITETTCTTQLVWSGLRAQGVSNFDFVGTKQNQQGCGVDNPDRDCEGHSGYLVTEIVGSGPKAAELPMWCAADRADLVLMHFGTNDAWNSGIQIADILSAYSEVVSALRAAQPHVIVLVAQIIPLRPDNCADCETRVRSLNDLIPRWAESVSTPESPVHVVNQWQGFDPTADTRDGVHPNMQGSQKMADVWLAALRAHNIF